MILPKSKDKLYILGVERLIAFSELNSLDLPAINNVPRNRWIVSACAFYRPDTVEMREWTTPGINICLDLCAQLAGEERSRNWSWSGSVTDRTPYGVLAHEMGHHCDWLVGERKGTYFSDHCMKVREEAKEPGLTSYANENPAEWYAEAFRLFVTNPLLLKEVRPRTFRVIGKTWKCIDTPWREALGDNVPDRIIQTLMNKGAA